MSDQLHPTDNLRTRIAAVLSEHVENQLTNYDAERNECGCGHQGDATYRDHLADAVIAELGLERENWNVDMGVSTLPRHMWVKPTPVHRYVTEWTTDCKLWGCTPATERTINE